MAKDCQIRAHFPKSCPIKDRGKVFFGENYFWVVKKRVLTKCVSSKRSNKICIKLLQGQWLCLSWLGGCFRHQRSVVWIQLCNIRLCHNHCPDYNFFTRTVRIRFIRTSFELCVLSKMNLLWDQLYETEAQSF